MSNIRMVTRGGKYYFAKCKLDEDGDVEKVIEIVEFKGKNVKDLRLQLEGAMQAVGLPVIVLNACSIRLLLDEDYED